jgi:hypothetical protein
MADLACYQRDQCVVDTTELLKAYMMMEIKTKEVMVDMLKAVNIVHMHIVDHHKN